jgi:hypothetical protein
MAPHLNSVIPLLSKLIHFPIAVPITLLNTFERFYSLLYRNHNHHKLYQSILTRLLFLFHLICTTYLLSSLLLPPLTSLLTSIGVNLGILQIVPTVGELLKERLYGEFWGWTIVVPGEYRMASEWYLHLYWNPWDFALDCLFTSIECMFCLLKIGSQVAVRVVLGMVLVGFVKWRLWVERSGNTSLTSEERERVSVGLNLVTLVGFAMFYGSRVLEYWQG